MKFSISRTAGWLAALLFLASGCAFEPADDCDAEECIAEWESENDDQALGGPGYADGLDEEVVSLPGGHHLDAPPQSFAHDFGRDREGNPDPQPWLLANDNPDPQPWEDEGENPDPQPWENEVSDSQNPDPQPWQSPAKASAYGTPSGHDTEPDPQPW